MCSIDLLEVIKDKIKRSINNNKFHGFIGYNGCDNICMDMDEVLFQAEELLQSGDAMTALKIAIYITLSGAKLASCSDSSSGMLTNTVNFSLIVIEKCAFMIADSNEEEKKQALSIIIRESKKKPFDDWSDWRYELLKKSIMLIDDKSAKSLEKALNEFLKKEEQKEYNDTDLMENKLIRYLLHRHIDGKDAVREELYRNIKIDKFCMIAVNDAIDDEDYAEAEKLCAEKAISNAWRYSASNPDDWNTKLYGLYELTHEKEKQIAQAKKILSFGDTSYWKKLKSIYTKDGSWTEQYPLLLEELKNNRNHGCYLHILKQEKELELLLNEMNENPKEIFIYGDALVKNYPVEVYNLCAQKIKRECSMAKNRREYKDVCKLISQLKKWGGKVEAKNRIQYLMEKYPRRSALLDELEKRLCTE